MACRRAGEKNFDAGVEKDVVTAEAWIKVLDKDYIEDFKDWAARSFPIYLFLISVPKIISQSLLTSCPKVCRMTASWPCSCKINLL
jgi:hypothetical protein